jgi:CheY-like chemotaxis protein
MREPHPPQDEPPVRVLIVEDDPGMRDIMTRMVHRLGYAVVTAAGGQEALDRLREQRVDIMLLDLMMPEMDGFEVCRVLQQDSTLPRPYIIITSARSAQEDRAQARALGAADYLTKPFILQDLQTRLEAGVRSVREPTSA